MTLLCRARSVAAAEKPGSAPDGGRLAPVAGKGPKGRRKLSEKNVDPFQNIGMKIQRY